jgi:hypothetical protein
MNKAIGMLVVFSLLHVGILFGADKGTSAEAEALVKKAIEFVKGNGKEKAFLAFSDPKGQFVDRDLYVFVYDMTGKCLAHGQNPKMIGKALSDLTDGDNKRFVKERIEIAKSKGSGWQHYKFSNPITRRIESKTAYVERFDDCIIGSGAYK